MKPFTEYFSDRQIIQALCRVRITLADQRHEQQYLGRLIGSCRQPQDDEDGLGALLPPRIVWASFRPQGRRELADPDLASLLRATLSLRQSQRTLPWVMRQNAFIQTVQYRVLSAYSFAFSKPKIAWEEKRDNKFRAIGMFNLEDNVICGLVAKYLKDLIDPAFEDSSYAFRAAGREGMPPTHHDAFNQICDIRQAAGTRRLYVAECDIRGFYDGVDHAIAKAAFDRVTSLVETIDPERKLDPRAARVFKSYLDCYSFPQNVLAEAEHRLKAEKGAAATIPWPADALRKHHPDPFRARIGVPQGGAISCIIANLVLDLADKRMQILAQQMPGLHFLRFCDDMVLIAPTKTECVIAFNEYLGVLDALKLPYHPAHTCKVYGKAFWSDEVKSRAPYCWAPKLRPSYVPWVQFVGYQIRYDGLVRVKPKSVKKQMLTMRQKVDTAKWGLITYCRRSAKNPEGRSILATRAQAEASVSARIISAGVGRVDPERPQYQPLPMCWANGFKALHGKPIVPTFLKQLDRERERQIRRFERAEINYGSGRPVGARHRRPNATGYLQSYHAQFKNVGGEHLIRNPR